MKLKLRLNGKTKKIHRLYRQNNCFNVMLSFMRSKGYYRMKKLLFILAGCMMVCFIIGTFFYYDQASITMPLQNQPNEAQENITPDEPNQTETKPIQPVNNEKISYSLQNEELQITYNGGGDWKNVPVELDALFRGEYNGNKQELIEDSYILEEDFVAFLYAEDEDSDVQSILVKYS